MRMKHLIAAALTALTLSGCSLVYRIDIPQGNYVEQKQVDKLRQGMTREQVSYVLGTPMLRDGFDPNTWYYLYEFQPGHGDKERKELTVTFANDRLTTVAGDFPLPAAFNTPL
ncbi:outer membrane protein assembly factor BamE [Aeromonas veronii]|uniref:outer membrane protein assembly factor BamE n=1 Tax=Aeromonas veronii TaxID=654 RepID=UPI0040555D95